MAAEFGPKTKLIRPQGFYFEKHPIFSSKHTANNVLKALMGEELGDLSVDDASSRAVEKLEALFSVCLEKKVLFRALRDCLLFWNTISHDFQGYFVLSPQEAREVVGTYSQARLAYLGKLGPTNLTSLVEQWIQVVNETNSLPPPASFNLAWRPGASDILVEMAQNKGIVTFDQSDSSVVATWPPSHFSEDEVMLFTSTQEFRDQLYAITSQNQGLPRTFPTDLVQAIDVRLFLCWAALVGTPSNSTKALYPTPVAFLDRSARQDWYRATGNVAMLYVSLDRFLDYAADAFTNRGKTSVTCLFTPWMMAIAPASDLHDSLGDQIWSHPRMARYGVSITLRLVQQTQQQVTRTALEVVQFDPWLKYRQQLKPKFAGHQVKMMELNKEVTEKIEEWAARLGGGVPIVGRWWGGNRVGGVEDDAVSMAAAFCLEFIRDRDLPHDAQLLEGLGFVNTNDF